MYTLLQIFLYGLGIVASVLFVVLAPLMAVFIARSLRHELDLMKDRSRRRDALKSTTKVARKGGKHRGSRRVDLSVNHDKREFYQKKDLSLLEEKELQAREDAFFQYYLHGDITGFDHPAYNIRTRASYEYARLLDQQHDKKIMTVANEGL